MMASSIYYCNIYTIFTGREESIHHQLLILRSIRIDTWCRLQRIQTLENYLEGQLHPPAAFFGVSHFHIRRLNDYTTATTTKLLQNQ